MSNEDHIIYGERLARLEEWGENMTARMNVVQTDVRAIRETLAQIRGGRALVIGVFALLGTVATVVIATVTIVKLFFRG